MKLTNKLIMGTAVALGLAGTYSCSNDDDGPARAGLTMEVVRLETLTNGARYEGWIVVEGEPISTGTFTSTSNNQTFSVNAEQLNEATEFFITVESDNDAEPSNSRLLQGVFNGTTAEIRVNNVIGNFSNAAGQFVLATPTDDNLNTENNDENGVLFINPNSSSPTAGLTLPELQNGWQYEGWVQFGDLLVSTGKFNSVSEQDLASPYSGNGDTPPFPGEDFLNSAPAGLTFPEDGDVRGKTVFISVEPEDDYDQSGAFFFRPLAGNCGSNHKPKYKYYDCKWFGTFWNGNQTLSSKYYLPNGRPLKIEFIGIKLMAF